MADEIYLEPLTVETVKRIIKKERPTPSWRAWAARPA